MYSAHLDVAAITESLPALCQKDDFGGRRFKLVATDEGISDTLNTAVSLFFRRFFQVHYFELSS